MYRHLAAIVAVGFQYFYKHSTWTSRNQDTHRRLRKVDRNFIKPCDKIRLLFIADSYTDPCGIVDIDTQYGS